MGIARRDRRTCSLGPNLPSSPLGCRVLPCLRLRSSFGKRIQVSRNFVKTLRRGLRPSFRQHIQIPRHFFEKFPFPLPKCPFLLAQSIGSCIEKGQETKQGRYAQSHHSRGYSLHSFHRGHPRRQIVNFLFDPLDRFLESWCSLPAGIERCPPSPGEAVSVPAAPTRRQAAAGQQHDRPKGANSNYPLPGSS